MHKRSPLGLSGVAALVLLATTLAGCGNLPAKDSSGGASKQPTTAATSGTNPTSTTSSKPPAPDTVVLTPSVAAGADDVKVSTIVSVKATLGTVTKVKLWTKGKDKQGDSKTIKVAGTISPDHLTWTAKSALDPSSKYRLEMQGKNTSDSATVSSKATFHTQELSRQDQTFASFQPLPGSKVGVGMPVMLNFDEPVKNKKEFEKHLSVVSTSKQQGSWHWYNSKTVHWRPKTFWKPGTKVTVKANLNGVSAGKGVYGQNSTSTHFTVGRSFIIKVNLKTDYAKVYRNGKLVKKIPVTGGKAGWRTRSGVKLIMGKEYNKVMTNEAIGAKESYRLKAKYAMRITNSGEFLHSAPWSIRNQGVRNGSHGCTGMSTANSGYLYRRVLFGDPVITTGSNRKIEPLNGWTDWNLTYKQYQKGSAL